jgi:hypothetical protein
MPIYFGLGDETSVKRIEVQWPSGKRQALDDSIPVDRLLTIVEER